MKKIIILALLCLTPVLIAMGNKPNTGSVGLLNNQSLFIESKVVEEINTIFNELETRATHEIELLQERIEALNLNAKDKAAVEEIQVQTSVFSLQVALEDYQNQILEEVDSKFNAAIENVRNSRKMTVVFDIDSAVSYDENIDITKEVIQAINAMKFNFPEIPDLSLPEPTKPE